VIVDSHVHVFPYLDGPCGFPSRAAHLRVLQYYMVGHGQPVRRLRDDAIVPGGSLQLYDLAKRGPDGLAEVDFRVTRNGRFEWTQDGEDRYIHFMPPSLQANESRPEGILAQMAYVGVDVGVLQNAHLYGRLDDEFADAVRRNPGKLVGLAEVDEPNAHTDAELRSLRRAVRDLGLKGLYYANRSFLWDGFAHAFDDPLYDDFWNTVAELRIAIFWELAGPPGSGTAGFLREIDRVVRWQARFPTIPSVLTHGLDPPLVLDPPDPVERLFRDERITIEVLYPIAWGRTYAYPYPELRPVLRELYRRVGATRLCWGSDMPNVERNCTYRQSLDYLRRHSDFIRPSEMDLILGDNLVALFGLR
jgi:predicted TIM-barrel fold metal-dependent hydrolase